VLRSRSEVKGQNNINADGSSLSCFETQSGVITASGKMGELGVNGDIGEWRTDSGGGLPLELLRSGDRGGEVGGRLALRGGRMNDCQ
jgi:hypothetical protein